MSSKFDDLIEEAVNVHLAVNYKQIPDSLKCELAIEHLSQAAVNEDFFDTGEFCAAKSFLQEAFYHVRTGDYTYIGVLFVREMWAHSQSAVEDAMALKILENEELAEIALEKARGGYL